MNKVYIKTPRQKRALEALLNGTVTVRDLGPLIGALNPRQIIFELRQQGFREIIKTRQFEVIDRDGKECHPGEYYVLEDLKPIAEQALKEYTLQARARRSGVTKTLNNIDINRKGDENARHQP